MQQRFENMIRNWDILLDDPIPSSQGGKSTQIKIQGTLADAKEAAVALLNEDTPGRKDVTLRIQTKETGTVCLWAAGEWSDSPKNVLKSHIGCLVLLVIIILSLTAWYSYKSYKWNIKNYKIQELSENCRKWVTRPPIDGTSQEQAKLEQEEDNLYAQCRNDVLAYVLKYDLDKPHEFSATADERRKSENERKEREELEKKTIYLGSPPKDWKWVVEDAIKAQLKDPDSAKISIVEPQMYYEWKDGKRYVHYVVSVIVNAKNSFGGYTGNQVWRVYFKTGNTISKIEAP